MTKGHFSSRREEKVFSDTFAQLTRTKIGGERKRTKDSLLVGRKEKEKTQ